MKKISVIIPTINRNDFLLKCIRSVESAIANSDLEYNDAEIIVIDDGHCDELEALIDESVSEISVPITYQRSISGPGEGPSASRNQGINIANSEIIYLLDDDDQFLPNRFSTSLKKLLDGDCDVVLERSLRVHEDGSGKPSYITGPENFDKKPFYYLLTGGPSSHITPAATSFTKSIFLKCGGYDSNLRYREDGELLLRLCLYGRVALVGGDPVCRISIHGKNSSATTLSGYWKNMATLSCLYNKVKAGHWNEEKEFLKCYISKKLDYVLTCLRYKTPSYHSRIKLGVNCIKYFPLTCMSFNNFKTICVWLLRG